MIKAAIQLHKRLRRESLDYVVPGFENYNPSDDPGAVGDGIITNGLNWNYDNSGSAQTAKGYVRVNTINLPAGTDNGWTFDNNTVRQLIIASTDGVISRYNNAGGWVKIGGPYTAGTRWDAKQLNNKLYLVNGADGILSWDGNVLTQLVISGYAGINPQYLAARKNRLYLVEKNSGLVWFSNPLDVATIQSNAFQNVDPNDGDPITGLGIDGDNVIAMKGKTVWYLVGEPLVSGNIAQVGNLQIHRADSEVGCASYKTVRTVNHGLLVFAANSGIYAYQNNRTTNICPELDQIFKTDMNPNFRHLMWSVYNPIEKKYILGYVSKSSSTPDKAIMVDMSQNHIKYAMWNDYPCSFAMNHKFTNTPVTIAGDYSRGIIYQLFQGYSHLAGDNGIAVSGTNVVDPPYIQTTSSTATTNNLVQNPGFEVDVSTYALVGSTATFTRNTGDTTPNGYSATLSGPSGGGASITTTLISNCTAGRTFTLSIYVNNASATDTQNIYIYHNGAALSPAINAGVTTGFQRFTATVTTTANSGALQLIAFATPSTSYKLGCIQVEEASSASAFFDGDTAASGNTTYSWSGNPHSSYSIKTITTTTTTTITPTTQRMIITDTSKAWGTNQFADSKVQIITGTGYNQTGYVVSNTATTLTLDRTFPIQLDSSSVYSIGAYQSFIDTKIFNFGDPSLTKKYKFLNLFMDSQNGYPLQVGTAYGKLPLTYNATASLSANTWYFEADNSANGWTWGSASLRYGSITSLYDQINLGGNERFVQCRFGTIQANQPWRINEYSFTYKTKKSRPN